MYFHPIRLEMTCLNGLLTFAGCRSGQAWTNLIFMSWLVTRLCQMWAKAPSPWKIPHIPWSMSWKGPTAPNGGGMS